jgi:thiamine-monophosphate kinase
MLAEFDLINRFFVRSAHSKIKDDSVAVGIGDDAAILLPTPGTGLVVATDTIVESVHFPEYTPAHAVGYRVLAVNLSDLAAMAARPRWANLSLALPEADAEWVEQFAAGFFALADVFGVELVGGDTVSGNLTATVTLQGEVLPDQAVLRSGATEADLIYVTGNPGDAVAGRLCEGTSDAEHYLAEQFLYPAPRVHEGMSLAGVASAMIDISDGLHADLNHLLAASDVGAELRIEALPLSDELVATVGNDEAIEMALLGGDDYELCFTVPQDKDAEFRELAASWDCPVTHLGTVVQGEGARWSRAGEHFVVADVGFDHFASVATDDLEAVE